MDTNDAGYILALVLADETRQRAKVVRAEERLEDARAQRARVSRVAEELGASGWSYVATDHD